MIFTGRRYKQLELRVTRLESVEQCRNGNHKWIQRFETIDVGHLFFRKEDRSKPFIACEHCGSRYEPPKLDGSAKPKRRGR